MNASERAGPKPCGVGWLERMRARVASSSRASALVVVVGVKPGGAIVGGARHVSSRDINGSGQSCEEFGARFARPTPPATSATASTATRLNAYTRPSIASAPRQTRRPWPFGPCPSSLPSRRGARRRQGARTRQTQLLVLVVCPPFFLPLLSPGDAQSSRLLLPPLNPDSAQSSRSGGPPRRRRLSRPVRGARAVQEVRRRRGDGRLQQPGPGCRCFRRNRAPGAERASSSSCSSWRCRSSQQSASVQETSKSGAWADARDSSSRGPREERRARRI